MLSRHNFWRTYHGAVAKLADPATQLRPTAIRILKALRADGGQTAEQLVSALANKGRAIRPATVERALDELAAVGLAAPDGTGRPVAGHRWPLPATRCWTPSISAAPMTSATRFATWLEDAGIPARAIDELMGHEATGRGGQGLGSAMGAHYRHTTPEMATRVITAIEARLAVVLSVAEEALQTRRTRSFSRMF